MSKVGSPTFRHSHTGVWTGHAMIVWGGVSQRCLPLALCGDGASYIPDSDTWNPTTTTGAPASRSQHSAVWASDRMVVWGGAIETVNHDNTTASGGVYDPTNDAWSDTPIAGAPASREIHTAIWTGSEMIVWGGQAAPGGDFVVFGDGGRLDPAAGQWRPVSALNAPAPRTWHTAVWTGSRMLVWGGVSSLGVEMADGGSYDPVTDAWTPVSRLGAPGARHAATAVWTGSEMAIWGGLGCGGSYCGDGALYDPATDAWRAMVGTGAPGARDGATGVWTGAAIVVWGGGGSSVVRDGGLYHPDSKTWESTGNLPGFSPRSNHAAVWTGNAMLIWGGVAGDPGLPLGDGAAYSP
jgi:N-acetylneuraminic acid mutarotase